jgi:hypothetical protein
MNVHENVKKGEEEDESADTGGYNIKWGSPA